MYADISCISQSKNIPSIVILFLPKYSKVLYCYLLNFVFGTMFALPCLLIAMKTSEFHQHMPSDKMWQKIMYIINQQCIIKLKYSWFLITFNAILLIKQFKKIYSTVNPLNNAQGVHKNFFEFYNVFDFFFLFFLSFRRGVCGRGTPKRGRRLQNFPHNRDFRNKFFVQ